MLRNHSVGFADTSRRLRLHFSTDFVRHFPRLHSAALLKCFSPSRRLCRLFSQASPALLAVFQTALLASFTGTSQMFIAFPAAPLHHFRPAGILRLLTLLQTKYLQPSLPKAFRLWAGAIPSPRKICPGKSSRL